MQQVIALYKQGRYAEAVPVARESLRHCEGALGADHPYVATALGTLALVLKTQGEYAAAKPLYERALKIFEKLVGPEHPIIFSNFAELMERGGLRLHLHVNHATSLDNLAGLLEAEGDYAAAKPLRERALKGFEELLGPEHPHTATSLNNLAGLLRQQGDWVGAKPLFERALKIQEKALGPEHPEVATSLDNLAGLLQEQGGYAAAKPLRERALKIYVKALGPEHPHALVSLGNLAGLLRQQGDYEAAKPLCERVLKICEKALGPEHPYVATSLNNLAGLLEAQGDYAVAKTLYERALKIQEKALGAERPEVAASLNNLAGLLRQQGDYAAAKPLLERALKICKKALGPEHPRVKASLNNLAWVVYHQGDKAQALLYMSDACRIFENQRLRVAGAERERAQFMSVHGSQFSTMVVWQSEAGDAGQGLNFAERGRARSLLEMLTESRARADETLSEELRQRRGSLLGRLNALENRRREALDQNRPLEPLAKEIKAIETELDQIAAEIRRKNPKFAALEYPKPMDNQQLVAAGLLDDKTALVNFTTTGDQSVALVLDHKGEVHSTFLPAENEESVCKIMLALLAIESGQFTREIGRLLHGIHQAWFAPVERLLAGETRLIVLADGPLHLLPLEMLLSEEPKSDNPAEWAWLLKKYEIHYAPSGTALAQLAAERRAKSVERAACSVERGAKNVQRTLVVVADPPFSAEQLAQMKESGRPDQSGRPTPSGDLPDGRASETPSHIRDVGRLFHFDPSATPPRLPGTRSEARGIAEILGGDKSLLLLGPEATERRVWELSKSGELAKYRYVHFATHGWVDTERPELSGLVLSLADKSEEYDGLLQMREIFALKLDADLVVLSACQTGRGKLMRGEGIVGLAQAFFYAGTPSVVVSLWNVNDASTALLMKRFYANLKQGMPKAAALREAKLWLMTLSEADLGNEGRALAKADLTRRLGEPVRSEPAVAGVAHPYAHPRHWAAFVLLGDSE